MYYTVYAKTRVETDSPGAAEEIAAHENVEWEIARRAWARRAASRTGTTIAAAWMATAPWTDGGLSLIPEHASRLLAPVTALLALTTG